VIRIVHDEPLKRKVRGVCVFCGLVHLERPAGAAANDDILSAATRAFVRAPVGPPERYVTDGRLLAEPDMDAGSCSPGSCRPPYVPSDRRDPTVMVSSAPGASRRARQHTEHRPVAAVFHDVAKQIGLRVAFETTRRFRVVVDVAEAAARLVPTSSVRVPPAAGTSSNRVRPRRPANNSAPHRRPAKTARTCIPTRPWLHRCRAVRRCRSRASRCRAVNRRLICEGPRHRVVVKSVLSCDRRVGFTVEVDDQKIESPSPSTSPDDAAIALRSRQSDARSENARWRGMRDRSNEAEGRMASIWRTWRGEATFDLLVVNLDCESDSFYRNEKTLSTTTRVGGLRTDQPPIYPLRTAMLDFDNDGLLDIYEATPGGGSPSCFGRTPIGAESVAARRGRTGFEEVQPRAGRVRCW